MTVARPSSHSAISAVRALHPVAASIVVALVCTQVYLIASYIFGDSGALSVHMTVGRIAVGFELLVLATAIVAFRHDDAELRLSLALVLVGLLQVSLAADLGSAPEVHAFHGLLALVVLGLSGAVVARTASYVRRPR
jgi:hypothetical protein